MFLVTKNANRKNKVENEAKRFDPSERNFNFEFRSWATAPREFGTLFLLLNSPKIQAFELEFNFLLRKIPTPLNPPPQGMGTFYLAIDTFSYNYISQKHQSPKIYTDLEKNMNLPKNSHL